MTVLAVGVLRPRRKDTVNAPRAFNVACRTLLTEPAVYPTPAPVPVPVPVPVPALEPELRLRLVQ